jgi:hypothetical protein
MLQSTTDGWECVHQKSKADMNGPNRCVEHCETLLKGDE